MSKIEENAHYYIAGAGLYYGLSWVFTFYPAFVFGLVICQQTDPSFSEIPEFWGFLGMLVTYGVIQFMLLTEKYVAVVIVYIATLWPFLHQIIMYAKHIDSGPGGTSECFPLPPVDWCPFW